MRGTDEIAGQQIADEERLREIELLRRRVKEMEEQVASAAAEGAPRANFGTVDATAEAGLNDNSSSIPAGDGAVCVVAANSGLGGAAGPPHELVTARVEDEHESLPCRTDTAHKVRAPESTVCRASSFVPISTAVRNVNDGHTTSGAERFASLRLE